MDREAIYKLIKAAEEALKPTHADAATLETKVKPDTENQYRKQARQLFGVDTETNEPNIIPIDASLIIANVRKAETVSTLRIRARSTRHVCMNILNMFLKNIDIAKLKGNWNSIEKIVSDPTFEACITLSKMMPSDFRVGWQATKKRSSQKTSYSKLPCDWREQIAAQSKGQYHVATLVNLVTGCRPAELEKGVQLERKIDGIYVTIKGAKVKENAGQKERCFRLADHPITEMISKIMNEDKDQPDVLLVIVGAKKGNSVSTHIRSIAKKLWPLHKKSITCYTARHAMAADCKKATSEGADPDLISLVLGHIVDKTGSNYGSNNIRKGGRSMAPTNVTATKPIKHKVRDRNKKRIAEREMSRNKPKVKKNR